MQENKNNKIVKRIKRKLYSFSIVRGMRRNKNMKHVVFMVLVIMLAIITFLVVKSQTEWRSYDVSKYKMSSELENGDYKYNENIISILLIGIDSTGKMETSTTFGDQARADNIDLISFDTLNKTVKILPISRDTMTDVTKFSAKGYEVGKGKTHLGYAFSFGNGGNESSMNVCSAVSDLLYGAEVYRYVTTNIDAIGYANELIGGVTVEVPNNDLAFKYPEMTNGNKVKLSDSNVADFLRYRDTSKDGSNTGRMERQEAFIQAYVEKLETLSKDDYKEMWNQLESDESKVKTNMTENLFMGIIAHFKDYNYNPKTDNLTIEGENKVEDGYDVFYPDENKLKELVLKTYFTKQ